MMKKNKFLIACVVCLLIVCTPIVANAKNMDEEAICINSKIYEYETDPEKLLQMAMDSQQNRSYANENGMLEVEQLVSEKVYSDGSRIKEYAKSSICLMEKAVDPANKSTSWGKYDIACVVTAHYEEHYGPGTETGIVLLYTTFSFNDAANAESVERYATYNNPSQGVLYSLNSDDNRIYGGGGFQFLYCGAHVTLSDGTKSPDYFRLDLR